MQQDSVPRADIAHALGQSLSAAIDDPQSCPAFRRSVCVFTDERKANGVAVERVIVELKHAIAQSHPSSRHLRLTKDSLTATDELITSAVRWCVERYFAEA